MKFLFLWISHKFGSSGELFHLLRLNGYENSNEHIVGFMILFEYVVVRFVIREFGIEMS
jgi:hypothetical protein